MPWNPAAQNLSRHVGNFTNNGTVQRSLKHHLIVSIKTGVIFEELSVKW